MNELKSGKFLHVGPVPFQCNMIAMATATSWIPYFGGVNIPAAKALLERAVATFERIMLPVTKPSHETVVFVLSFLSHVFDQGKKIRYLEIKQANYHGPPAVLDLKMATSIAQMIRLMFSAKSVK